VHVQYIAYLKQAGVAALFSNTQNDYAPDIIILPELHVSRGGGEAAAPSKREYELLYATDQKSELFHWIESFPEANNRETSQ
jgi:hypothetical protein